MNLQMPVPAVVLDTNVLLDWLVYRDPSCLALGSAIETGALRWLAAQEMRAEWDEVLARGVGAQRLPDVTALASCWKRFAKMLPAPLPHDRFHGCHCTDPDDQIFIDLALSAGARWLLSRDRAVLKAAPCARRRGLLIVTPSAWSLHAPP